VLPAHFLDHIQGGGGVRSGWFFLGPSKTRGNFVFSLYPFSSQKPTKTREFWVKIGKMILKSPIWVSPRRASEKKHEKKSILQKNSQKIITENLKEKCVFPSENLKNFLPPVAFSSRKMFGVAGKKGAQGESKEALGPRAKRCAPFE
jgi:hypothetical protein